MIKHYALSSEEMKQIRQKFGEHKYSSCPTWFDFPHGGKKKTMKDMLILGMSLF